MSKRPVVLIPGGVLPAELAYADLRRALGADVDVIANDHAVYAAELPPADYTLDLEVEAVLRAADERGFGRFHLVGYSGGGAVALVLCAGHPERLLSLTLMEPAWAGNETLSADEQAQREEYDRVMALPEDQRMGPFMRAALGSGAAIPEGPTGPAPPWMAKRPAGLEAFWRAFARRHLELDRLRAFGAPVLLVVGGRSSAAAHAQAQRLAEVFPDARIETYAERHHFDPPHRAEAERLAVQLHELWDRADRRSLT